LYGCLKDHRELIPVVVSGTENLDATDLFDHWTPTRLQEAFERLVSQTLFDIKFAFFIDGLDENSGSHGDIAGILKQVSQRSNVVKHALLQTPTLGVIRKSQSTMIARRTHPAEPGHRICMKDPFSAHSR